MVLNDQEAVVYLTGINSPRDGRLECPALIWRDDIATVEMVFTPPSWKAQHRVHLTLLGLRKISFHRVDEFREIPFFKCFWTGDGEFYMSLDPWVEGEPPTETDNDVFRAASVRLITDGAWFMDE